jgi:hypothetical protein
MVTNSFSSHNLVTILSELLGTNIMVKAFFKLTVLWKTPLLLHLQWPHNGPHLVSAQPSFLVWKMTEWYEYSDRYPARYEYVRELRDLLQMTACHAMPRPIICLHTTCVESVCMRRRHSFRPSCFSSWRAILWTLLASWNTHAQSNTLLPSLLTYLGYDISICG